MRLMGMLFANIIGQDRVVHSLARAIEQDRVAHAYIFHGPDGVGKRAVALALAGALQCTEFQDGDACGKCNGCHKAGKGLHPDIHVLMPTTTDVDLHDVSARLQLLAQDPYERVDFQHRPTLDGSRSSSNKQIFYSVEHINAQLRRAMSFHRAEGLYRVAVLLDVDRMRSDAANAFLKLLEEPGDRTVFILITNRIDHLLPTVISRCQQVRFLALSNETIEKAMLARNVEPGIAAMLSRMADGSISRALELFENQELLQTREKVLEFLRLSYQGKGDRVVSAIDSMIGQGREYVKFQLQVIMGLLRDLLLIRTTGDASLIVNIDQIDTLTSFSANLPDARLESMIEAVEETCHLIERNVNLRLALIALSRVLARAMRGEPSVKLETDLLELEA